MALVDMNVNLVIIQLHPVVDPHVVQARHVPLLINVKFPHVVQASPVTGANGCLSSGDDLT